MESPCGGWGGHHVLDPCPAVVSYRVQYGPRSSARGVGCHGITLLRQIICRFQEATATDRVYCIDVDVARLADHVLAVPTKRLTLVGRRLSSILGLCIMVR